MDISMDISMDIHVSMDIHIHGKPEYRPRPTPNNLIISLASASCPRRSTGVVPLGPTAQTLVRPIIGLTNRPNYNRPN